MSKRLSPACQVHPSTRADVVCQKHKEFLCTRCLINGEHARCDIRELRQMTSPSEAVAIHLLVLTNIAKAKLLNRNRVEEEIGEQEVVVATQMDHFLDLLKRKLAGMKNDCVNKMREDFEKKAELAEQLKEKRDIERVMELLHAEVDILLEADSQPQTPRKLRENQSMSEVEFLRHLDKKRQAQKTLSHLKETKIRPTSKFTLAFSLIDICTGRRRNFGKAALDVRSIHIEQDN
ncbi:uncharacterized protein LOC128227028 [Mya arenaria]|uniref:uncharacterized protein LOC128227028 n=1 Tax=Mya arenaria TaxID=6604 RepID=UPI0022E65266|nr:uncharacterized protein LOC128227028 [Mya arenaria]